VKSELIRLGVVPHFPKPQHSRLVATSARAALLAYAGCATLYDVVGSVKGHLGFTSREGSFFSSPIRIFSLSFSFISTKARCVNLAVESSSTNHLFGHLLPTMILFSDAAIARGSKAPNQPNDGLASTRVAPGLPCLRTSCA
jgi:hypothetical protein